MLNFFRRRDTVVRIMLGGFLVVICVAMVLFLIPQGGNSDSNAPTGQQTVATVNGTTISGADVSNQLARFEGGQQVPAQLIPMLGQEVLRNLVSQAALTAQARQLGLVPTDAEVVQAAQQQAPVLYPNGKYIGDDQAGQILAQSQMTLPQFEDQLRQSLMTSKLYNLVTDPVRVSDAAVRQKFETDNEKATFDYAVLKPTDLLAQVQVTPAALDAFYKQHLATYNSPERRTLEVLLANQAQIGAQIPITDAAVQQYYRQNIADYSHPEQVKCSRILLKFPETTPTTAEVAATRAKADAVLKQVQAKGADFAALAKKNSQDDASASQGGELGFIQRNQTVPNFEKVAFTLPVGQISGLVQTELGFDIIKVEAHDPAHVQSLTEVHDQIVSQLQKDQAVDKAQNLMNQAEQLAHTQPLPQVAKQLNLQYFSTAPLSRTDPITGIGVNPDFANAVFTAASGAVTPPVQVAQGFALAKVDSVIPPGPQPLDAVRDAVTTDYKQAQSKTLATTRAQSLEAAAQKQGLKAAAASLHIPLKTATSLTRAGSLPNGDGAISSFADTLFGLKPGQAGPIATNGDTQIIYALTSVQQPTDAEYAAQRTALTENMVNQKRTAVFGAYQDALVARLTKAGKITVDQDVLQRVLGLAAPASPGAPAPPPPAPLGLG